MNFFSRHPSHILISGGSFTGKTTFVLELLRNLHLLMDPCPQYIIFIYSEWQPIFDTMQRERLVDQWVSEIPDYETLRSFALPFKAARGSLIIADDLGSEFLESDTLMKFSTVQSHHLNCSLITITHSLFMNSKNYRISTANAQYYVLMKNLRNQREISTLFSQIRPYESSKFVQMYQRAVSKKNGYLIIDLHVKSSDATRLRTSIFPTQSKPMIVYLEQST